MIVLTNPRIGQTCFIHYRQSADSLPYQNRAGVIRQRSYGRPRNHLVEVPRAPDDFRPGQVEVPLTRKIVVPCGNLFTVDQALGILKRQAVKERI